MEEKVICGISRNEVALKALRDMFQNKSWFRDVGLDQYGRYVVYSTSVSEEVMSMIPETIEGKQVLCHFASSQNIDPNKFVNKVSLSNIHSAPSQLKAVVKEIICEHDEPESTISIVELEQELEDLEKMCSPSILQEIFFEVHDGANAITNLGSKYPLVRFQLEELYNQYGFDLIYDNLEI